MRTFKFYVLYVFATLSQMDGKAAHENFLFDISYQWVSDSTYEITAIYFRPCQTNTVPSNMSVVARSISRAANLYVFLPIISSNGGLAVPNVFYCADEYPFNCYREYVYRGFVTLSGRARDWEFGIELCCFSSLELTNYNGGVYWSAAGLNNLDFPDQSAQNWSPQWHDRFPNRPGHAQHILQNYPFLNVCAGRPVIRDMAATEYQGDMLRYEVVEPTTKSGAILGYKSPYGKNYPLDIDTPPSFWLDSVVGQMYFKPINHPTSSAREHTYLISLKATEYRYDTNYSVSPPLVERKYLGYVMRHMYITIRADSLCPDSSFSFGSPTAPHTSTNHINTECPDTAVRFGLNTPVLCSSVDTNGSFIILIDSSTNLPVAIKKAKSINCSFDDKTQIVEFVTQTALKDGFTYYLILKQGNDGNTLLSGCGSEVAPYEDTLRIHVNTAPIGLLAGHHLGGGNYSAWIYEECHTTTLLANFTVPVKCNSIDTLGSEFALHSPGPPFTFFPLDRVNILNCNDGLTQSIEIETVLPLDEGNYGLSFWNGTDGNTVLNVCNQPFTSQILNVKIESPHVQLGRDTVFCEGEPINFIINAGSGFRHYQWNTGSNDTFPSLQISDTGEYFVKTVTQNYCESFDTIVVSYQQCHTNVDIYDQYPFEVFPNPAGDFLTIHHYYQHGLLTIRNMQGRMELMRQLSNSEKTSVINVANIPSGLYIMELKWNDQSINYQKVIITH